MCLKSKMLIQKKDSMLTLLQIPLTTDSVNAAIESVPVTTMPESGFSIFDMLSVILVFPMLDKK